jgi:hypothetical protein
MQIPAPLGNKVFTTPWMMAPVSGACDLLRMLDDRHRAGVLAWRASAASLTACFGARGGAAVVMGGGLKLRHIKPRTAPRLDL